MRKLLSILVIAVTIAGMTMIVFADGVEPTTPADPATPSTSVDPVNPAKPESSADPKIMPFAHSGEGFARMHRMFGFGAPRRAAGHKGAPCPSPKGVPAPQKPPVACADCKATPPKDGAAASAAKDASKLDAIWAKVSGLTVDEAVAQGLIAKERADNINVFRAGFKMGRGAARGAQVNGGIIGRQGIQGMKGMPGMPGMLLNCVRMMRRMSR